jgi:hypothetical protein
MSDLGMPELRRALVDSARRQNETVGRVGESGEEHAMARRRWSGLRRSRWQAVPVMLLLVLATATITLAATGVILTGSPVGTSGHQKPAVGFGVPAPGGSRLLALRASDPAGGLPWGMRIIRTTRGYVCVQIGRVDHGRLGELGIDGAFHDDGRFHPLPVNALPNAVSPSQRFDIDCDPEEHSTFAGDLFGLEASAASNPRPGVGSLSTRREVSFGLLGPHAIEITYRAGSTTHTGKLLPGLGAYLIVQRMTSGGQVGGISDTMGSAEGPASPNGALRTITYRYHGKTYTDNGHKPHPARLRPVRRTAPKPVPLPAVHEPLHIHLHIRHHTITAAEIVFRAPYPVTSVHQGYFAFAYGCHGSLSGGGLERDVAKGAVARISIGSALSDACGHSMTFKVDYTRTLNGIPGSTPIGIVTVRIPPGTHPTPLPRRVVEQQRRSNPTRSLRATIHLTLLPQTRAACSAAFLLYPCYKGEVGFTTPYAVTAAGADHFRGVEYSIDGFATCKAGGRPETSWGLQRNVRAHEAITTTSLGLFVLTPSCLSSEGFEVTYLNHQGPTASAPHESVIVGTATLSKATLPNGQNPKPPAG